jgi:hypothetical protein
MESRVTRGLAGAYQRTSADGINRIALQSTDPPTDPASMTLRAHTRAVDFAAVRSGELIKQIDETTRAEVRKAVQTGVALHWDVDKLAERIQEAGVFSNNRAVMIARTETNQAQNAGMLEAGRQAAATGRRILKRWTLGSDPCPLCLEASAEGEIELDEDFGDAGEQPPLHPNCECEIELFEPDEEEADEE